MNEAMPGSASYDETFARLAALIAAEEREHGLITEMSQASFREWVNDFVQRAARALGIAAAKVAAAVADYAQIALNAVGVAKAEFRKNYDSARRIRSTRK